MNGTALKLAKFFAPSRRFISLSNKQLFGDNDKTSESGRFLETTEAMGNREKCINEVTLIGRVGTEPKRLLSAKGSPYVRFQVVTSTVFGAEKYTDWHEILTFRESFCYYILDFIGKGDRVYIKGKLCYSSPVYDAPNESQKSAENSTHTHVGRAKIILSEIILIKKKFERKNYNDEF